MDEKNDKRRVAIACQGGGSHTAFTAGALKKILNEQEYEIVALSGTSGGAVCAFLTWYALLEKDDKGEAAGRAAELLDSFWRKDNSAYLKVGDLGSIRDVLADSFVVGMNRLAEAGFGIPAASPYDFPFESGYWRDRFKGTIEKRIDQSIRERVERSGSGLMLFIGAVNVLTGEFKVFKSHEKKDGAIVFNESEDDGISVEAILASAAVPTVFKAERTGKAMYWNGSSPRTYVDEGVYWDGLYSQNPPLSDLTDANPDEIWVIQINPEEIDKEPTTTAKIQDRRNELGGNLSLNQEIRFVRKINDLVRKLGEPDNDDAGTLRVPRQDGKGYKVIKVRRIELTIPLYTSSKLDRSPSHIDKLIRHGEERAAHFLEAIPFQLAFEAAWEKAVRERSEESTNAVMDLFAKDAVVEIVPPADPSARGLSHAARRRIEGLEDIRTRVEWCLEKKFNLEQSRDYRVHAGGRMSCWALFATDHFREPVKGRIELVVREDRILSFAFHLLSLEAVEELRKTTERGGGETVSG